MELDFLGQGFRLWGELSSRAGRNTILGRRRRLNDRSGTDKPGLGAASGSTRTRDELLDRRTTDDRDAEPMKSPTGDKLNGL